MDTIENLLDEDGALWRDYLDQHQDASLSQTLADPSHRADPHDRASVAPSDSRSRRHHRRPPTYALAVAAAVAVVLVAAPVAIIASHDSSGPFRPAEGPTSTTKTGLSARPGFTIAMATNRRVGYVKNSDLNDPFPANPAQALRWQTNRGTTTRLMPVYDRGGTAIGQFEIDGAPAAGRRDAANRPSSARPSISCSGGDGIAFTLNPPTSHGGAANPDSAAAAVYQRYGLTGYTEPPGRWTATYSKNTATVTANHTAIAAHRLADNTWIAIRGQHCR